MSILSKGDLIKISQLFTSKRLPDIFIETGTFHGDTVDGVKSLFSEIHTFELDKDLYEKAQERFRLQKNVHCHFQDSAKGLEELLSTISKPIVFWLDAHYAGPGTARGAEEIPLLRELEIIGRRRYEDIIIIDDVNNFGKREKFEGDNDYRPHTYDWKSVSIKNIKNMLGWRANCILVFYPGNKLIIFTNLKIMQILFIFIVRQIKYLRSKLKILL